MIRPRRAGGFCLGILLLLPIQAFADNRDIVHRIADFIENNYFDEKQATAVADELRAESRAGKFDSLESPRDLASTLTSRLRQIDRHFMVSWSEGEASGDRSARSAPADRSSTTDTERPRWFGFRRVEMQPGGIGYIDLRTFVDFDPRRRDEAARRAADAALELISGADAVILDLRENGGGSPAMAGYLVSAFVPAGADVYNLFHRRDGTFSERPALPYPNPHTKVPLFVLISGRTASAAESAAYTLQAAGRAIIVGSTSAGAANPGGFFPVGDGFNVFVPTGTPVNPITRTNWEATGVIPDVPVANEQALRRAQMLALDAILSSRPTTEAQWTLEAMRAEHKAQAGPPLADYAGTYGEAVVRERDGRLTLQQSRRPVKTLLRLNQDTFFVQGEPTQRVQFARDPSGRVNGFEVRFANGRTIWFRR